MIGFSLNFLKAAHSGSFYCFKWNDLSSYNCSNRNYDDNCSHES